MAHSGHCQRLAGSCTPVRAVRGSVAWCRPTVSAAAPRPAKAQAWRRAAPDSAATARVGCERRGACRAEVRYAFQRCWKFANVQHRRIGRRRSSSSDRSRHIARCGAVATGAPTPLCRPSAPAPAPLATVPSPSPCPPSKPGIARVRRGVRVRVVVGATHRSGRALGGGDVGEVGGVAPLLGADGVGGGCPQGGDGAAEHGGGVGGGDERVGRRSVQASRPSVD